MDLNNITANLRPRSNWEAIGLGIRMVQQYWRSIYLLWACTVLPICLLIILPLYQYPVIAGLIVWWLKPIYDRGVLFIISRTLFGDTPTLSQSLKSYFSQCQPGWFVNLIPLPCFRFSLSRSFKLPIWQLEKLTGEKRRERLKILSGLNANGSFMLTILAFHLETILFFSIAALLWWLMPEYYIDNLWDLFNADYWQFYLISNIFYIIAMSVIEPFYVAAGFMLYINRRSWLEGWDIEIKFKQIASRLKRLQNVGIIWITSLFIFLAISPQILANTEDAETPQPEITCETLACLDELLSSKDSEENDTGREIATVYVSDCEQKEKRQLFLENSNDDVNNKLSEILADPVINGCEKIEVIDWEKPEESESRWNLDFLNINLSGLATTLENLLWALLFAAVGFLAFKWITSIKKADPTIDSDIIEANEKESLSIIEQKIAKLPNNIIRAAQNAWNQKAYRVAMSLLYRGMIKEVMKQLKNPIEKYQTEQDLLSLIKANNSNSVTELCGFITALWIKTAYAKQQPSDKEFEEIINNWHLLQGKQNA